MDQKQYNSAIDYITDDAKFSKTIGNMTNNDDKVRLKAYELYEDFYYNRPEHIRVVLRGEDDDSVEIYIPSAKKCIEAVNRFLGVDFNYFVDPDIGSATDQAAVDTALTSLFKNEKVLSKFNQMKRHMLVKGDACFHVIGMPGERAGKRVKIQELKPEHFFPIEDLVTGYCMGCHIVDIIRNPRNSPKTQRATDEFVVRRQTYRKLVDDTTGLATGRVSSELSLWEIGRWDDRTPITDRDKRIIEVVTEEFILPPEIVDLPVYHWKNAPPTGSTFGMSECAGVESIITAINQAMTDEDLTLITQGLGVYWTDASPPVDEFGNETEWEIGPGSVVQISPGGQFSRVSGITTVSPYLEHVKSMDENMQQAMGVPDIAIGMVDVSTAESGIALSLKLGPLLAKNAEKELLMVDETDEFLFDLVHGFLPAYEKTNFGDVQVTTQFGDPMPVNQKDELQKVLDIWTQAAGALPVSWLYDQLNNIMGYDLDVNSDFADAIDDATQMAGSAAGPMPMGGGPNAGAFGDQLDAELGGAGGGLNGNQYDFANAGGGY
jgi:hypothetical protein